MNYVSIANFIVRTTAGKECIAEIADIDPSDKCTGETRRSYMNGLLGEIQRKVRHGEITAGTLVLAS